MKLLIDDTELRLLLEKRRDYIGRKIGIWDVVTGFSFLVSVVLAEYHNIGNVPGIVFKTVFVIVGITLTVWGIFQMGKAMKEEYSQNNLYNEIKDLNEIQHEFSIVAVKDTFNKHPNRFLLYYDERWDCRFFFSFKTTEQNNEDNIRQRLSLALKVDEKNIDTEYKSERIERKHSVPHDENRVYAHKLYYAKVKRYSDILKQNEFEIDGRHYYWMTLDEMENDERIRECNLDVVRFVKEMIV
ncbi:MAG: hypothetical protein IJ661_00460 [Lachnospiraceae bacterium]|nr:hypothetical protein [Lachnospiraceae bacterium]